MNERLGAGFNLTTDRKRSSYGARIAFIVEAVRSLNNTPGRILPKVAPVYADVLEQVVSDIIYDFAPSSPYVGNGAKRQIFYDVKDAYERRYNDGFYETGTDWILDRLGVDVLRF